MDLTPPLYRRPLPSGFPAWLMLAGLMALAGGYFATFVHTYTALTVVSGCGIGFLTGLLFSMAMAARLGRAESPAASYFRPPIWLSVPASVALLVLIAHALIDETLRQGSYDGYRRRGRYFQIPGFLAVCIGCGCLAAAGRICAAHLQWPRTASRVIGGLLGVAVLLLGLYKILVRVADMP